MLSNKRPSVRFRTASSSQMHLQNLDFWDSCQEFVLSSCPSIDFHNCVVQQLALINEAGRFSVSVTVNPQNKAAHEKVLAKRDNHLVT
ncbi:hypothetical protein N7499_000045 [Penicillium canescens]|uniref:Uncharacterized protein n=1 Tax=Penicillium canescens TaxID=5083 RepID=A0AAD6IG46_PENCN|nr:uncharacterized protein N7446_011756 [Penicillium canescens]KAJ6003976.1 hypothetical protein N7522_005621 [Penicillium canescens]KAJ6047338.1 hypothetical protein N7460_003485 [Penicillium canescens]KAJ6049073.1 hypothetical protein N7446_011756 [Penicillium canescens]KAJ6100415.1 hypothetical protein N7499_000045 [Penicillium canescens]KAJ6172878.1 hypothetical protein N7485_005690 [Penicillium canescens]